MKINVVKHFLLQLAKDNLCSQMWNCCVMNRDWDEWLSYFYLPEGIQAWKESCLRVGVGMAQEVVEHQSGQGLLHQLTVRRVKDQKAKVLQAKAFLWSICQPERKPLLSVLTISKQAGNDLFKPSFHSTRGSTSTTHPAPLTKRYFSAEAKQNTPVK